VRKLFLVIAGILMFYLVRIFFKRLKNAAATSAAGGYGNQGGGGKHTLFTAPKGRSFPTDRVVEDASYTEIEPGPGK